MKTSTTVEPRAGSRRPGPDEIAVELALHGRWSEAADLNRRIIELVPDDVRARNRLARALEALGRIAEAQEAYAAALGLDPHDRIAGRGLARLSAGSGAAAASAVPQAETPPLPRRPIDYGRLEPRVEEPPEIQDEYLEPYEEYETDEPERATAERVELAGELLDEARLEELEGAFSPDQFEEEARQEERDLALAAEEESDQR